MESTIRQKILEECEKLIQRYHLRTAQNHKNQIRYRKRSGALPTAPQSYEPEHWSLSANFNPFHVRSRVDAIAHAISRRLSERIYEPHPASVLSIPKPAGGTRDITIFPVADAAVSNYLFRALRDRNQQFFSSYAYRGDRTAHHAVEHLFRYARDTERVYALNYDFSKYFDSIDHDYVKQILRDYFRISDKERAIIDAFLNFRKANRQNYGLNLFQRNIQGVPQGSSISLFLANAACLQLDLEIEREGAVFARYADDTIILCNSYSAANRCANLMHAHGKRSKTVINFDKSEGIFLLTREPEAEIRSAQYFDFLGNRISQSDITVSARSIRKIKNKISAIIHRHPLLYPSKHLFSPNRIAAGNLDWDLVTCLNEIRRYLYGHITEEHLSNYLANGIGHITMTKSLLSYYPLVNNPDIFRRLDGWLVNVIKRAQRRRRTLIANATPNYQLYSENQLISGSWYVSNVPNETRLPSFFRGWLYVRKLLDVFGAASFPVPNYES